MAHLSFSGPIIHGCMVGSHKREFRHLKSEFDKKKMVFG